MANTTNVSHGVPCWLAALFDLLKGVDVFESESKNRKIKCTFTHIGAQRIKSYHSYHYRPQSKNMVFLIKA